MKVGHPRNAKIYIKLCSNKEGACAVAPCVAATAPQVALEASGMVLGPR